MRQFTKIILYFLFFFLVTVSSRIDNTMTNKDEKKKDDSVQQFANTVNDVMLQARWTLAEKQAHELKMEKLKLEKEAEERDKGRLHEERQNVLKGLLSEGWKTEQAYTKVYHLEDRRHLLEREEAQLRAEQRAFEATKYWHTPQVVGTTILGCAAVYFGLQYLNPDNGGRGRL